MTDGGTTSPASTVDIHANHTFIRSSFSNSILACFGSLQDYVVRIPSQYKIYEDVFFNGIKDGLTSAREHSLLAGGVAVMSALLIIRGPRRFLFRNTFGRFQSEEALFVGAQNSLKELDLSVGLVKKESTKLFERATLAENEMERGRMELLDSGSQLQHLTNSFRKAEARAADVMHGLREVPGREALKLRAEVATMLANLKGQRSQICRRILKISDMGVPI